LNVEHKPVLVEETMDWLAIKPGGLYIDATVGLGGHAIEIVRRLGAGGRLVGLDRDAQALEIARGRPMACWQTWAYRACSWIWGSAVFRSARAGRWTCAWTATWKKRLPTL
jgi:16S rRNA C1402 N4-methylase RsmH